MPRDYPSRRFAQRGCRRAPFAHATRLLPPRRRDGGLPGGRRLGAHRPPHRPPGRPESTDRQGAVVHRFYAAVNEVLHTGDPTAIDTVVDPDLVAHAMPASLPPTRAGLARHLRAIRAAFPGARLAVEAIVVQADTWRSRVRVTGTDTGASGR